MEALYQLSRYERKCINLKDDPHQQHILLTDQSEFADAIFKQFIGNSKFRSILFIKAMPYESKMEMDLEKFLDETNIAEGVKVAITLKPCGPERLLAAIHKLMISESQKKRKVRIS